MSSCPISGSSSSFMTRNYRESLRSIETEREEMKVDEEGKEEVKAIRELSHISYPKWDTVKEIYYKKYF